MSDINELADTLKSFWKFMLLFALIIAALVFGVNAVGWMEKTSGVQVMYTAYDDFPPYDERVLKITLKSYELDADVEPLLSDSGVVHKMVPVDIEAVESAVHELPFFILEGDGFIEVSHSNTTRSFVIGEPAGYGFEKRYPATNGVRFEERMAVQLELRMAQFLDASGGITDWRFTDVTSSMREFNKLYNEYLGEVVSNVPARYRRVRRYAYESHMFVKLYSKYMPSKQIAAATIKITVTDDWRDGIGSAVLTRLGIGDRPECHSRTTVCLVDYWQADPNEK